MKSGFFMVDKSLILRKLSTLEEYQKQIQEYAGILSKDYTADWKIQRIVERTLQMMIETCLDISGHIISDEKLKVPETYVDMFRILVQNGILKNRNLKHSKKWHDFEILSCMITRR